MWDGAVRRSRGRVNEVLAAGGLDHEAHVADDGVHASLRRLLCDLIEESATAACRPVSVRMRVTVAAASWLLMRPFCSSSPRLARMWSSACCSCSSV